MSEGGMIGPKGRSDMVPARLSDGEQLMTTDGRVYTVTVHPDGTYTTALSGHLDMDAIRRTLERLNTTHG